MNRAEGLNRRLASPLAFRYTDFLTRITNCSTGHNTMRHFLIAFVLIATSGQVRADLIINGGFEQPLADPTTHYTDLAAGNTALTGWTIVSGSVDTQDSYYATPYKGNQTLDLDGFHPGHIQQSFSTVVGNSYSLTFAYANNIYVIDDGSIPALGNVSLSGLGVGDLFSENLSHSGSTAANMNWIIGNDTFVANSTTTTLDFASLDSA
jgi:choice-of-anchor C domain-containing protein